MPFNETKLMKKVLLIATLMLSANAMAQCSDLFFSEYLEGSSNNKAIEIYNPTNATINLSDYVIYRYNNGSAIATDSLFMEGNLLAGDVYVAANPSAVAGILSVADTLHTITFYNGDDALLLKRISSGVTLDAIGIVGVDPGTNWAVGSGATSEFTLVRSLGIQQGQLNWAVGATEWTVFPQNMLDSLGAHSMTPCAGCVPTSSSISAAACVSYTSPSGLFTYTTSGIYADTVLNAAGCDSIISINLTIGAQGSSMAVSVCSSYTSPSGLFTWTTSGNYSDTIPSVLGCDSIIAIDLTIGAAFSSISVTECVSYTSPSGSYTWTTSGIYADTIPSAGGCDSIITIDLTIGASASSMTVAACQSYVSPSGTTWTSSGVYTDVIPNAAGCDSVITVNLTITSINTGVTLTFTTLIADQVGATYQWLDCANFTEIAGETNSFFSPVVDGLYAVEITLGGCVDTSACTLVELSSLEENAFGQALRLSPNPTSGAVNIDLGKEYSEVVASVYTLNGQLIGTESFTQTSAIAFNIEGEAGIYFLVLETETGERAQLKVVKH